jgi:hypothetical protein
MNLLLTVLNSNNHKYSSILQRWKRALHVPLRLDVYYQHADSRRELLERWCLEYAPKPNNGFVSRSSPSSSSAMMDPIVQLRHVCKQIVIWLRTLYCWSRMLPAQALRTRQNSSIGFSIYVVSEGNDDVSGLVSSQGFSSRGQPHSVVTPYGELGWKVFYAPPSEIQRLLPQKPAYPNPSSSKTTSTSRPIPMKQQQQQQQQHQHHSPQLSRELYRRDSTPPSTVQSAPHGARMYHRSCSDGADTHRTRQVLANNTASASGFPSFVNEESVALPPVSSSADNKPPIKNLSALSLAMMTMSDESNNSKNPNYNHKNGPEESSAMDEAAEKRRAALHHAPPQIPQSPIPKKHLAPVGEYGYAYNNHIPTLRAITTTTPTTTTMDEQRHMTASPSLMTPLSSTPPGYLLGGPTPPAAPKNYLIPPRPAVTPPFAARPMGFIGEPAPSQPPAVPSPNHTTANAAMMNQQPYSTTESAAAAAASSSTHLPTPISKRTSLDLLHSSPFQQPLQHYGSVFGAGGGSSSAIPSEPFASMTSDLGVPGFSSAMDHHHPHHRLQAYYEAAAPDDDEDMPFAVDAASPDTDPEASAMHMGAASFATSSHKRLALFDSVSGANAAANANATANANANANANEPTSTTATNTTTTTGGTANEANVMSSLAEQLAEFKSFGASLHHGSIASDSDAAASTSTPIPLRT